jgi:hypothetical protein
MRSNPALKIYVAKIPFSIPLYFDSALKALIVADNFRDSIHSLHVQCGNLL